MNTIADLGLIKFEQVLNIKCSFFNESNHVNSLIRFIDISQIWLFQQYNNTFLLRDYNWFSYLLFKEHAVGLQSLKTV